MTAPHTEQRPAAVEPTPVTALLILRQWSYADDEPLDFNALTTPAKSSLRSRG